MSALLFTSNPSPAAPLVGPSAPDRLTWIVELMSRYAKEKCESLDSARLAAAIVAHLKSFAEDRSVAGQLAETVSHWLDTWEPILEHHVSSQRAASDQSQSSSSLNKLVLRARYA